MAGEQRDRKIWKRRLGSERILVFPAMRSTRVPRVADFLCDATSSRELAYLLILGYAVGPPGGARALACRVHTRVNAIQARAKTCSHECEHGTLRACATLGT